VGCRYSLCCVVASFFVGSYAGFVIVAAFPVLCFCGCSFFSVVFFALFFCAVFCVWPLFLCVFWVLSSFGVLLCVLSPVSCVYSSCCHRCCVWVVFLCWCFFLCGFFLSSFSPALSSLVCCASFCVGNSQLKHRGTIFVICIAFIPSYYNLKYRN